MAKILGFFGENVPMIEKKIDEEIKRNTEKKFVEFDLRIYRGKDTNVSDVINHLSLQPLGKKRVAVIYHVDEVKVKDVEKIMEIASKREKSILIISAFLNVRNLKNNLYTLISSANIEIKEFKKPGIKKISDWVKNEFFQRGYTVSDDALYKLIDMTDGAPSLIANIINKIELYAEKGSIIDEEIMEKLVGESVEKSGFQLSNLFFSRNQKKSIEIIENVKMYGRREGVLGLIGILSKEIAKIIQFKSLVSSGFPKKDIPYRMQFKGTHEGFVLKKLEERSRRWKRQELFEILYNLFEIDFLVKSTSVDGYLLLEKVVARI